MMLRTEFAKEKRATPSGSPEKPPRGGGERQLPDAVAARLIAVANTKADDAERRVFEMEESTAKRVANAEAHTESAREELRVARNEIGALEHHVATLSMKQRDDLSELKLIKTETNDMVMSNALKDADNKRLRAESALEAANDKNDELTKALQATRDAARRAITDLSGDTQNRTKAFLSEIQGLTDRLATAELAREKAESVANEHELRRIRAIESLLRRAESSKRAASSSSLRAALAQGTRRSSLSLDDTREMAHDVMSNPSPNKETLRASKNSDSCSQKKENENSESRDEKIQLTSAEEDLCSIESEHLRELDRLRGDLAVAKGQVATKALEVERANKFTKQTVDELSVSRSENARLFQSLDCLPIQSLGGKGVALVVRTLKALDQCETKTVAVYAIASDALRLVKKACDAAEDVVTNDEVISSIVEIERGVEGNWVFSRDLIHEAFGVVNHTVTRLRDIKKESASLGRRLRKSAEREANAKIRADNARRSKEFGKLTVVDSYPKFYEAPWTSLDQFEQHEKHVASSSGFDDTIRSSTKTEVGGFDHDDLATPLRLTRQPMSVASSSSRERRIKSESPKTSPTARPVSPGPPPRASSETRDRSATRLFAHTQSTPPLSPNRPNRSPAEGSAPRNTNRSSLSKSNLVPRSPVPVSPNRSSPSPSSGAHRRVTFGANAVAVYHPDKHLTRPHTAPTRSRVGAYIRGETAGVVSPAQEKMALARAVAVEAARRLAYEARLIASNPRHRNAPRPWRADTEKGRPQSAPTKPSLRSQAFTSPGKSPLSSFGKKPVMMRSPVVKMSPLSPMKSPMKTSPMRSFPVKGSPFKGSPSRSSPSRSPARNVQSSARRMSKSTHRSTSPKPRDAEMACHKSPSKVDHDSQKYRDKIVSRTLRP